MFVLLISSKTKIIALILLLVIGSAFIFQDKAVRYFCGVKSGVMFLEHNVGGYSREELTELIGAKYGEWVVSPVDAVYDEQYNSIIPELWGCEVNLQKTVDKIMQAHSGEKVTPVLETLLPDITLNDYPWAYIRQGNPLKTEVSFMINVAWGTEYIPQMLAILDNEKVSASFFVVGSWAENHEDLLRQISNSGHTVENHGHTDAKVYTELTPEEMEDGLKKVNSFVQNLTGRKPKYYTPHKGEYNELVLEAVSRQELRTVLWSIDTIDWMLPGVQAMKSRVLENLHGGAIVLMHPTEDTVIFLRETIPLIKDQGFQIVSIEKLLDPNYNRTEFK
ncbi:MAG: polysaccharide deacetylase family protein [Firmicutes bacterium]|nr:polysaccharide deacetylase family protein [Bacillota bacterium]